MNANFADFSSLGLYDADFFKPPPPGEEYPRPPSPPNSEHYSQWEGFSYSKYGSYRNATVEDYLNEKEGKVPIESSNLIPSKKVVEYDFEDENDRVILDRYSDDEVYPARRNRDTIRQILRSASAKELELLQSSPDGGILFCFVRFQRSLQIRWNVIALRRLDNLLKNRVLESIPKEWLDFDRQFAMIYGPVDESSVEYSNLIKQFETGRKELNSKMRLREYQVWEIMQQNPTSDFGSIALELERECLKLEAKLKSYSEANLDLNPFTNGLGLDLFVLPRLTPPIQAYKVRPVENDMMIEFNMGEDTMFRPEGYNAAVIDVGCLYPQKVMGDESRIGYWKHTLMRNKWQEILCNLKMEMGAYPVGVESSVFANKFRETWKCSDDEVIFGKNEDDTGVLKISDVFFHQFLGKDRRVILFHGILEGLIVTPEEILVRVWRKLRHLLELYHHRIELDDLEELYEMCFAQPLYTLQWGFGSISEFVEYSIKTLAEDLADVKVVERRHLKLKKDTKDETVGVNGEKKNSDEHGLKNNCQMKNEIQSLGPLSQWMVMEEPVPTNVIVIVNVINFPYHIPFDFMF